MTVLRARATSLLVLAALVACDRSPRPAAADSVNLAGDSVAIDSTAGIEPGWLPALGTVVAIPVDSATGWLLYGDIEAVSAGATTVHLIDDAGGATAAEIVGTRRDGEGCELVGLSGSMPGQWSAAIGGSARPIALQSMEMIAPADSQRLVRDLARLASRIPTTGDDRFAGLPFVVADMWIGTLPDSTPVLAARIRRQINQEASPMEEQTFIIAERGPEGWATRHTHRAQGTEESVESTHLVALLASAPPTMLVTRESGAGTSLVLLERAGGGWKERYASARRRCP